MAERQSTGPESLERTVARGGRRRAGRRAVLACLIATVPPIGGALAQPPTGAEREALRAETAADHAAMIARLGIRELRPGPSGDESKPDHANYDEALANPYPVLPDPLTLKSGTRVATALGSGTLPEAAGPEPAASDGHVPCKREPTFAPRPTANGPPADPPAADQLTAAGWGFASLSPTSVQADNGAGLTRGIIGLVNKGERRAPDDWGALRAWAWGASRGLDFLATQPSVDARRVGVEGVSRYGKAALIAMAFDQRFAVVLVGSSGEGGAKLHRRRWGEQVENLTASGEYHWMAGNFLKYGAAAADFGSMNPPAVNLGLLDGALAWRQHDGGHTDGPNWKYFLPWAERMLRR
jgi:glucuronyl esterase-like protein